MITEPMRAAPNHVQTNSGQSGKTSSTRSSMFAPELAQRIAGLIRQPRDFSIRPLLIFEIQADFILPAFLEIVIEEVVGHVEPFGKRGLQSES